MNWPQCPRCLGAWLGSYQGSLDPTIASSGVIHGAKLGHANGGYCPTVSG